MNNPITTIKSFAYNRYKEIETQKHRLQYLFLEITRKCNLSCLHCGSDCSSDSSMEELSKEQWFDIIDQMYFTYRPFFVITGGEPLVRRDFFDITARLKSLNAPWGMVTNGLALTEEKLDQAISDGLNSITVSLDGSAESHTYIRQNSHSYSQAVNALELIGKKNIKFKDAVTCVYPKNLHLLDSTAELLLEKGITSWRLFRIFPKGAATRHNELMLSFEQSREMVQWIANNRAKLKKRGLAVSFSCEGYLNFSLDRKVRDEPFFCRAGVSIASILADGSITGCNNNSEKFYQGNIKDDTFSDVWNNRFTEYRDHEWKKTGICKDCKKWDSCKGSSIHLREKNVDGPLFCYEKKI